MQGIVLAVNEMPAGDELDSAVLTGATSVTLVNPLDFNMTGGQVTIDGVIYVYTGIDPITYVMTLSTPLLADIDAGVRVNVYPDVIEKWATIELQANDDAVLALVPHALWDKLDEGVRDPADQEGVEVGQQNGDWLILDVMAVIPTVNGQYIDPTTAPTPTAVDDALDKLRADVSAQGTDIDTNTSDIENAQATATSAGSRASIADVKVTLSDYEPAVADAIGKNDGSMWMTRTRTRRNFINNPSFEVDTVGWTPVQTVALREASATIISGTYTCRLTNSGVSGIHSATADNGGGASRVVVTPGQTYTGSCFALAVSGTNNGVYCQFDFFTSAGTFIGTYASTAANPAGGTYGSPATVLDAVVWSRLYLTVIAPPTAAYVTFSLISPAGNESAVWRIDGAVLEADDILGRYFDGRSYDGSWSSTPDASPSVLGGGRVSKVFELDNGGWVQRWFSGSTLVDLDLGTVTTGTLAGTFLTDNTVPIDKFAGTPIVAGATLAAGDLVNVYNSGGLFRMQKADAGAALLPAHGFVLTAVTSGSVGYVYSAGYNPYLTGLTPGPQFLSNVPGKCAGVPPTTVGSLIQRVGVAGGAIVLNFTPGEPIYIV
jgi:hypothetical protein